MKKGTFKRLGSALLALVMLFIGGLAAYTFVWDLGDVGVGLMTVFNIIAILLSMSALALLLQGGIIYVMQTMDTYAVATHVNMALINCTLPIMAAAGIVLQLRDLIALIRTPASAFKKADPMDVEAILEKAS